MSDLKAKIKNLAAEYSKKSITDFHELFHENPTTSDLEELIHNELIIEQKQNPFYSYLEFNDYRYELKQASITLRDYYSCLEQTLNKILLNVNQDQKDNNNLIKVLVWKKNIAAIRCYVANNIISEINQTNWDLTPNMINLLFENDQFYSEV
jgi:hypothetical protein